MLRSVMRWVRDKSMLTLPRLTTLPDSSAATFVNSFHSRRQWCAAVITVAVGGSNVYPEVCRVSLLADVRARGTVANPRAQQVYCVECEWEVTHSLNVEPGGGAQLQSHCHLFFSPQCCGCDLF